MNIDRIISLIKESRKSRKCPPGSRWSKKKRTCVPKKSSRWRTVYAGWGRGPDEDDDEGKKNGKKNGSNGSGNSNGGRGNGNGGHGNGGNGNGGGSNGGGGE